MPIIDCTILVKIYKKLYENNVSITYYFLSYIQGLLANPLLI